MDRQTAYGAMPWRYVLGLHPPWAHWAFFVVWAIAASVGPIVFLVGLLAGSGAWVAGLVICGVALLSLGVDWLVVRRLRRRDPDWTPWQPPRWASGQ
jgi:hypothetical protein